MMKKTSQVVDDSAASMSELTNSIQEISSASNETRKIVYSIDEIAFAKEYGYQNVSLGNYRLRTETALRLLGHGGVTVLRANASEILALAGAAASRSVR